MVVGGSAGGSDEWKREGGDGWKGRKDGVVTLSGNMVTQMYTSNIYGCIHPMRMYSPMSNVYIGNRSYTTGLFGLSL
jgi:hypothetical protein